jgi:hypothetical protein
MSLPVQATSEPLDLRVKTVSKDFDRIAVENYVLDSVVSFGEEKTQDEQSLGKSARSNTTQSSMSDATARQPRYGITRWNEHGHIHGSQWARYNIRYQPITDDESTQKQPVDPIDKWETKKSLRL